MSVGQHHFNGSSSSLSRMLRKFSRTVALGNICSSADFLANTQDGNIRSGVRTERISDCTHHSLGDGFCSRALFNWHSLVEWIKTASFIRNRNRRRRRRKKDKRLGNVSLFSRLLCKGYIYLYIFIYMEPECNLWSVCKNEKGSVSAANEYKYCHMFYVYVYTVCIDLYLFRNPLYYIPKYGLWYSVLQGIYKVKFFFFLLLLPIINLT